MKRERGPLDIINSESYKDKEFRWFRSANGQAAKYHGYVVATKEDFPELSVGYNDATEGTTFTYRDMVLYARPIEMQIERRKEKKEKTLEQTILRNAVPDPLKGATPEVIDSYKVGTTMNVPKVN